MKKILTILTVLMVALQLHAADVDLIKAQSVAQSFMNKQVANGRLRAAAATGLKLAKAEASVANPKAVDYYIFNAEKAYVVVAGDDQAPEILMYGEEGTIDLNNIPPAMQWMLNKYKYQIDGIKAGTLKANGFVPKTATAVPPLVTANWDQSSPYNNQCPTSGSSRALTGCPATSLSMCYYKWKWPKTFPAVAAIPSSAGIAAAALPEREADWDNIIDEYTGPTNYSSTTAQKNAVAWLMRYAGQAIPEYSYGTSASGANDPEIYQGVLNMGYTDAQYLLLTELVESGWGYANSEQYYTDAQWNEYMMNELLAGNPIEYLAYDYSSWSLSGHAFNVFGCDSSGKYYVNWGWSGDSNGYCTLHNFTTATGATGQSGSYVFNYGEAMIIGIRPPAGALGPGIIVSPKALEMTCSVGKSATATFTVKGQDLTEGVTATLTDANGVFSMTPMSVSLDEVAEGKEVTVTFTPKDAGEVNATITLTSGDVEPVTVNLKGVGEFEKPTLLAADENYVKHTSFRADWTDITPAEKVASYTLEVSNEDFVPPVQLIGSLDGSVYTGSYTSITLQAPWGGKNVKGGNNAIYFSNSGSKGNITYTIPEGYNNATFTLKIKAASGSYGAGNFTVATPQTAAVGHNFSGGDTYAWVVKASSGEKITITTTDSSYSPDMALIEVYTGDATAVQLKAAETGDESYRLIEGITDMFYVVKNLMGGGSYYYRVKAVYGNGSESDWSNVETVTLNAEEDPGIVGDVNLSGNVDIDDVNIVIAIILGKDQAENYDRRAYITDDDNIDVDDVNALIRIILNK